MKALLLSIKPEYVEKILQGEKKYEYRKRLAKEDVSYIYVYSTAPSMKVVASVHIEGHLSDSPCGRNQNQPQVLAVPNFETIFVAVKPHMLINSAR